MYATYHRLTSILFMLIITLNFSQAVHQGTLKDSDMQKGAREAFKANMLKRLSKKPWIADHCETNRTTSESVITS